jgi:hypothetical protein
MSTNNKDSKTPSSIMGASTPKDIENKRRTEVYKKVSAGVYRSNSSLKSSYLYLYGTTLFLILSILVVSKFLYFSVFEYDRPDAYITVDENGRIKKDVPMNELNMPIEELKQHIVDIMVEFNDVDYLSLDKKPIEVKNFFIESIYTNVIVPYYENSNDMTALRKQRGIKKIIKINPPTQEGDVQIINGGHIMYKFKTYIRTLTYYVDGSQRLGNQNVEVSIFRVPESFSETGWLISGFVITDGG